MRTRTKVLISGVAALAVAGVGIGVAEAAAATSAAAPSATSPAGPSAGPSTTKKPARHPGSLARVEHGQFTLNGKQHRTVDLQRGTVQAVNATSVTVRSADGFTTSYAINGNTKVQKNKQPSSIDKLAVNDRVTVRAGVDGPTVTADHIADSGPAPAK